MNALPELQPITVAVVTPPTYNDANLGNEGLWVIDNAPLLAQHWVALGRALGLDDPEGEEDITLFIHDQHARQLKKVAV